LFLETIHIRDGRPLNIQAHQERFDATRRQFFAGVAAIDLETWLQAVVAGTTGRNRCSLVYERDIQKTEVVPYVPRIIRSLTLVEGGDIDYSFKYSDRTRLITLLELRGAADEIIIVKDGGITDTSYSNLVFLKDGTWYTPATPLLKGTRRQLLLDEGRIREEIIMAKDLAEYSEVGLINAMLDLGEIRIETKYII
jgi:4-amino-4-deoxychorismate lyase